MTDLFKQDKAFTERGAIEYHNAYYPTVYHDGMPNKPGALFARHYFNAEGTEIGYVIPDFFSHGLGVHVFETPRVWDIGRTSVSLVA